MKKMLLDKFHFLGRKVKEIMTKKEIKRHPKFTLRHPELVSGSIFKKFRFQMPWKQDMLNKFSTMTGFTLAETLITLMTIGIVAVLVIPQFINNIGDTAFEKQRDVAQKKFIEGLRQMRTDGILNAKYTTKEFVTEMQKYFKIDLVCDSDHLTDCFTDIIHTTANNETVDFDVADLKTAKDMDSTSELETAVYGLKLADGSSILLYTDPTCTGPAEGAQDTSPDACIRYLIDVNNTKGPNTTAGTKDIVGTITLSKGGGSSMVLLGWEGSWGSMTYDECETLRANDSKFASVVTSCCGMCDDSDYWAQAVYECQKKGMRLPNQAELTQLAKDLGCPEGYDECDNYHNDRMKASVLAGWGGNDELYLLSSSPYNGDIASYWYFDSYDSRYDHGYGRDAPELSAICVK